MINDNRQAMTPDEIYTALKVRRVAHHWFFGGDDDGEPDSRDRRQEGPTVRPVREADDGRPASEC